MQIYTVHIYKYNVDNCLVIYFPVNLQMFKCINEWGYIKFENIPTNTIMKSIHGIFMPTFFK